MRKLTAEELGEPNVELRIPATKYYALPKSVQDEIRLYRDRGSNGVIVISVPAYVYREWEKVV